MCPCKERKDIDGVNRALISALTCATSCKASNFTSWILLQLLSIQKHKQCLLTFCLFTVEYFFLLLCQSGMHFSRLPKPGVEKAFAAGILRGKCVISVLTKDKDQNLSHQVLKIALLY